jgi:hypothetical protein
VTFYNLLFFLLLGHLPPRVRVPGPELELDTDSGSGAGSGHICLAGYGSGPELDPDLDWDRRPLFTDVPYICEIFYGGPDSDLDPFPGAGSGSGSAGPVWVEFGPEPGPGPDLCLDPDLKGGEGGARLTMTQYIRKVKCSFHFHVIYAPAGYMKNASQFCGWAYRQILNTEV